MLARSEPTVDTRTMLSLASSLPLRVQAAQLLRTVEGVQYPQEWLGDCPCRPCGSSCSATTSKQVARPARSKTPAMVVCLVYLRVLVMPPIFVIMVKNSSRQLEMGTVRSTSKHSQLQPLGAGARRAITSSFRQIATIT